VTQAERRQLTVMFVDLVGSTAISARLDPEEMRELLRAYQGAVTAEIERLGGRVARFLGDAVLCYFGWPAAHEDDAERAVRAGLAAVAATAGLRAADGEPLAARVGIATGVVVAGDLIGEGPSWEEAVVGETPNLAARLQALAGPGMVVTAERTRQLVGGLFDVTDLGMQALKGLAEPVRVWQVRGIGRADGRFEALRGAALMPLVGREQELTLLLDRWLRAKQGEGQVVLLGGEPGIGKSRLVRALRDRLGIEAHTSLQYQCSPHHAGSALWPVIEQLERAAGITPDDPPEANLDRLEALLRQAGGEVRTAAPLIADLIGLPAAGRHPPPDLTPQRRKALTFEALLAQLMGLAARGPVLLVLEDAHWIDPTSLELFEQVVSRMRRLPVLLVVTFRPEFRPPWTSEPHAASLKLARFGRKESRALAERVAGGRALPAEVLGQILAKTDGVPLFLEELTKTVLETGLLKDPLPAVAIPSTLNASLMARLDRMAAAKEVAQTGAVIGREFSRELLVAIADRSVDELDAALRRLIDAGLIFRRSIRPDAVYAFKHALVRDAAYESLLKSTRQRLHAKVARALEQQFQQTVTARPDLVAYHYAQARLIKDVVPYYLQAGRNAVMRSSTTEATGQLMAGLEAVMDLQPVARPFAT
jgi:class 3 adenylate cyclase